MSETLYRLKPVVWREVRQGDGAYLRGSIGRFVVEIWPSKDSACVWHYDAPGLMSLDRDATSIDEAKAAAIAELSPQALQGFEPVTQ